MSIRKSHTKNKDKFLDRGGANEVTVADVKSAVDLKHAQNTDIALDQGQANEVTAADARTHLDDITIHRIIDDGSIITTGLWSSDKINTELSGKANTSHTHVEVDITDLDKYTKLEVDNLLALQDAANELATDTTNFNNNLSAADTTIQLALDTIDNLALGGAPAWGDITGTLSNQTDLQVALDAQDELSELDDTNFTSLADDDFLSYDLATDKWINEPFTSGVLNSIFEASAISEGVSTTTSLVYAEKVKLNYTPNDTGDYLIMWAAATASDSANKPIELRVQQDDGTIINESTWGANFVNAFSNNSGFQIVSLTGGVATFFDLDFRNSTSQGNPIGSVRRARISIFRIG